MIVSVNAAAALRTRLIRAGGAVRYAFDHCLRNRPPSG
jgi:hypothetical protein